LQSKSKNAFVSKLCAEFSLRGAADRPQQYQSNSPLKSQLKKTHVSIYFFIKNKLLKNYILLFIEFFQKGRLELISKSGNNQSDPEYVEFISRKNTQIYQYGH